MTLTIISAYHPNPPSAGVMGVYAQHCKYFNSINRDICPREAFIIDLTEEITKFKATGDHLVVMLDGNEDMRRGDIHRHFTNLQLREVILQKHGMQAPSTYRRNTKDIPIDGIWATYSLDITAGGYFAFDEVVVGMDHRTLWIDISYNSAFGYESTAPMGKPSACRLNNQNPRIRNNFNQQHKDYAKKAN
jgi:hypothetical protein